MNNNFINLIYKYRVFVILGFLILLLLFFRLNSKTEEVLVKKEEINIVKITATPTKTKTYEEYNDGIYYENEIISNEQKNFTVELFDEKRLIIKPKNDNREIVQSDVNKWIEAIGFESEKIEIIWK